MSVEPVFTVPHPISFTAAIELTESLLAEMEQGKIPASVLGQAVRDLVSSENGARGFFVTYLSDPRPLAERPPEDLIGALRSAPDIVSPLLVKNLVMSTAMAITHRRQRDEAQAEGSDRVRSRTLQLIQMLALPQLQEQAAQLATSIRTGTGNYQAFLDRWNYDPEQKKAMASALEQAGLIETSG